MATFEERKAAHARESELLADDERRYAWAENEMQRYNATERRRILFYLANWVKKQPGHGAECNCGECD
jgi:hypothetical protein